MRLLLLMLSILLVACQPASKTTVNNSTLVLTNDVLEKLPSDVASHWLTLDTLLLPIELPKKLTAENTNSTTYLVSKKNKTQVLLTKKEQPSWLAKKFPHLKRFQAYSTNIAKEQAKKKLKTR